MKTTSEKDAVAAFLSGQRVALVEYRFGKAETVHYRDKQTGKAAEFTSIRHTVEGPEGSYILTERVADGFKADEWKPEIAKGTRCLLKFSRYMEEKGVGQFSGTLEVVK